MTWAVLAEGEAGAFVAEALADDLDGHLGSKGHRSVSMPQIVKSNSRAARVRHGLLEELGEAVWVDGAATRSGHYEITVPISITGFLPSPSWRSRCARNFCTVPRSRSTTRAW